MQTCIKLKTKIYLHHKTPYKINNVTEFTKAKNYFKLIDMRVHLN